MPTLTVTGDTPVNEYSDAVNITATVVPDSEDGNITKVYVFKGTYTSGPNVVISGESVSITGAYISIFPKSITYLDTDRVPQTVPTFEDLPETFFLLTNYTASRDRTKIAEFLVHADTDGEIEGGGRGNAQSNVYVGTITQTVTNDYTAGKNALQAAVPKGIF